ncbi:MAG TPA: hypothetical protein DHW82_03280 [Spirochaetia bacterium]|nr:hypothetical protein [Spirochaetia bacterium]
MVFIDEKKQVITLEGELGVLEAESIYREIHFQIDKIKEWDKIILDLREVEKMDSSVFQILLSFYQTYKEKIVFRGFSKEAERVFQLHGLKVKNKKS